VITRPLPVAIFFLISVAPIALFGVDGPWHGGDDVPNLAARAAFPSDLGADTPRRAGLWFNDRVGMRFPLFVLGSAWRVLAWRHRIRGSVLFGRDSWLFFSDDESRPASLMSDVRGRLRMADADIAKLDRQMAAVGAAFSACGKASFVLVAPNKSCIYPEQLRDTGGTYPRTRLDDVIAKVGPVTRAMLIDPRAELRAAKHSHAFPVYYRTDTHWNALGALTVYQKVVAALARANAIHRPELAALGRFALRSEPFQGGDLAVHILFLPWQFADERIVLRHTDGEPQFMVDGRLRHQVLVNPRGRGRLLLQGDSFAVSLAPLLARHFGEVVLLSTPGGSPVVDGQLSARLKADVTLIEVVERHLGDLVLPPRNLDRACAQVR